MKYNNFHAIGLHRSGTKWLSGLMEENFEVVQTTHLVPFWKHLCPIGGSYRIDQIHQKMSSYHETAFDPIHCWNLPDNIFFLVTHKPYDMWVESVLRNPKDFEYAYDFGLISEPGTYPRVYYEMTHPDLDMEKVQRIYDSWMEFAEYNSGKENFFWRPYIDWLNNWEEYLGMIETRTGWKRKHNEWVPITQSVDDIAGFDYRLYDQYVTNEKTREAYKIE